MSTKLETVEDEPEKITPTRPWWMHRRRLAYIAAGSAGLAVLLAVVGILIYFTTPVVDPTGLLQLSSIKGPDIENNFADPCYISSNNGTHYAFATNKYKINRPGQVHIQLSTSTDFVNWTLTDHDALPNAGNWSTNAYVWSPDVVRLDSGTFVMYYTAQRHRLHCIGAASSQNVTGPYIPNINPLICPLKQGGALDPEGFLDADGKRYLVYKIDGNSFDKPRHPYHSTPIMLQEVEADGMTLVGSPIQLMDRELSDGLLIEGPALGRYITEDGVPMYILFFSSHLYSGPEYNVKFAVSKSLTGPYTRADMPFLETGMGPNGHLVGPGGIDIGVSSRQFVFHSIKTLNLPKGTHVTRNLWTGEFNITKLSTVIRNIAD